MPASLGSTSGYICSPAPERANGYGGEGALQLRLKGLVFVFTSDRGGHVTCEHARNAGQGRLNSLLPALVLPCGASGMDCVTCHKTDGFTPPLNNTNTKQSYTNTNILSYHSLYPTPPFKSGAWWWDIKFYSSISISRPSIPRSRLSRVDRNYKTTILKVQNCTYLAKQFTDKTQFAVKTNEETQTKLYKNSLLTLPTYTSYW